MRKIISIILSFGMLFQQSGLVYAVGELNLANYLSQAKSSIVQPDQFRPAQLRYISYDIKSNDFKLLLDKGGAKLNELSNSLNSSTPKLNPATQELFNYFLIGLALPNDTFWVNLRPDAPENIIDPLLEKTDIGKIFLEADLQLKKDTASFTSPQNPEGKAYWDKLYKKAGELFGTENITIPTITRPWIVPNEVIVRETEDSAYIYKATLKVMLEADYLADQKTEKPKNQKTEEYGFSDPRLKELNEYSSQIIRETIIPKLTKEINSSKRYAQLRQVYYSLVLARWFKQKYSSSGSASAPERQSAGASANSYLSLIDSGNLVNLTSPEPCDKQTYFQAYQKSFKDGEYSLKETVATPFGQSIRSYISGGVWMTADSSVAGIKVPNKTDVTEILTGQHSAIANSPLTLEGFNSIISKLTTSRDSDIEKVNKMIKFGLTIKGDESKKSVSPEIRMKIDNIFKEAGFIENLPVFERNSNYQSLYDILLAIKSTLEKSNKSLQDGWDSLKYGIITHFTILEEKEQDEIQDVFDGVIKKGNAESGGDAIARFIDKLNKKYSGNKFSYNKEVIIYDLEKTMQINTSLSLFEGYNQQQKSLEEAIKYQVSIVVGSNTNKVRFDGLRDHKKVKTGVEEILKKILKASPDEVISYESLELASKVFEIVSQEDKAYPYHSIISPNIMPIFNKFLEKKSSGFEINDIQVEIRTALSDYIQTKVISFLKTFIKQNKEQPYGKFIGKERFLYALSVELEQKTYETVLGETDYGIKALSRIINKLRELSEDAKLKTVKENVSLIKIVTAGSPLTGVSSAIGTQEAVSVTPKRGGIDLTDRMLNMRIERVGSFASSSLALPEIADLESLDLDKEYERIQGMVSSSIRPSDARILEFAAACYYKGEFNRRLAQVSSCIKSAHLADELLGKESSPALRLATMLPDALYGG